MGFRVSGGGGAGEVGGWVGGGEPALEATSEGAGEAPWHRCRERRHCHSRHSTLYTLHSTLALYTLHPAPGIPHPTPHNPHPKRYPPLSVPTAGHRQRDVGLRWRVSGGRGGTPRSKRPPKGQARHHGTNAASDDTDISMSIPRCNEGVEFRYLSHTLSLSLSRAISL